MSKPTMVCLLAVMLMAGFCLSGTITTLEKQPCCISGVYKGWNSEQASPACPEPRKGSFIMYVYQEKNCGQKIWGKVVDPENPGEPMSMQGFVTAGTAGCCIISGTASKPGESVTFKGELCRILGVWSVRRGKFQNSPGCGGTFGMKWEKALHRVIPSRITK